MLNFIKSVVLSRGWIRLQRSLYLLQTDRHAEAAYEKKNEEEEAEARYRQDLR